MKKLNMFKGVTISMLLIISICFFAACNKGEPINRKDLTTDLWRLIEIRDGYNNMLMDSTEVCYSVWLFDSTSNEIIINIRNYNGEYEIIKNSLKVKINPQLTYILESSRCNKLYNYFTYRNCGTISIQNDIMQYKINVNKVLIFKRQKTW